MGSKEKAQGFKYDFTPAELCTFLFRAKNCPDCSGKLTKEKSCEQVLGRDVNSISDPFFVQNARVNHYQFIYRCEKCGNVYSLEELTKCKRE